MRKNRKRVIYRIIIFFVLVMNVIGYTNQNRVIINASSNASTVGEVIAVGEATAEEIDNKEGGIIEGEEQKETTSGNITISTSLGYERYVKVGRYIRINSKITNQGEDFTGELRIVAPNGERNVTYAKDVVIASGETKNIAIDIPVTDISNVYRLKLIDAKGKEKIKETISSRVISNSATPYIGILSDNISDLSYFRTSQAQAKIFSLDAKTFADSYLGLDMLDIILINDFDTSLLNEQQYIALKDWVNNGGTLVLGTGSTNQKTLQLFQDDFIGGKIGTLDENGILDIAVEKASIISKEENHIIHQKLDRELGNIQVFAVDLSIYNEDKERGKEIVEQILMNLSETKLEQLLQESGEGNNYYTDDDLYNAMDVIENKNMPAVGKYAVVLIFYIILVGPILYLILKKIDKRNMMWLGVPAISIVFALSIYGLGTSTRINKPYIGYVNILKVNDNVSNVVKKETYFSVTSPSNKNYGFEVEGDYQIIAQNRRIYDYYSDPNAYVDKLNNVYIRTDVDKTSVKLMNNAAFSPAYFKSNGSQTLDGMYQSDIRLNNSKLEGSFLNEFGFDITNASVYSNYQLVSLGTIKDKEKVELSQKDVTSITSLDVIYQQDIVSSIINGGGYYYDMSAQDRRKAYVLENYLQDNYYSIKDQDFLIGFVEETQEDDMFEKIGYRYEGVTVIIIPLNVPSYQNGKDSITNIISYGTVIEGDYDEMYNHIYDNLIIEYTFPENMKVSSLIYDKTLNNFDFENYGFEGVVKAYNYQTKEYDIIFDTEKMEGMEEVTELEAYFDPMNKMRLKYEVDRGSGGPYILPVISITKEVKTSANNS